MNDITYIKTFARFLKEKDAYGVYFVYLQQHINLSKNYFDKTYYNINNFINMQTPSNFLMSAFNWSVTEEGDSFWCKMHSDWLSILRNINKY